MKIIAAAASLMDEKDCDNDAAAKKELSALQKQLREITRKKFLLITEYNAYWCYTSLETAARNAIHLSPQKMVCSSVKYGLKILLIFRYYSRSIFKHDK